MSLTPVLKTFSLCNPITQRMTLKYLNHGSKVHFNLNLTSSPDNLFTTPPPLYDLDVMNNLESSTHAQAIPHA